MPGLNIICGFQDSVLTFFRFCGKFVELIMHNLFRILCEKLLKLVDFFTKILKSIVMMDII